MPSVVGCAPPSTRRAIRAVASSVVTASRRSSSEALPSYATLDDLREAVTTLEETARLARRVLGGAHPTTVRIEGALQGARTKLAQSNT